MGVPESWSNDRKGPFTQRCSDIWDGQKDVDDIRYTVSSARIESGGTKLRLALR